MIEQGRRLAKFNVDHAVVAATPPQHCESCHHLVRLSFLVDGTLQSFGVCPICGYPYMFMSTVILTDWSYEATLAQLTDLRYFWRELKALALGDDDENIPRDRLPMAARVRLHCRDAIWCRAQGHEN